MMLFQPPLPPKYSALTEEEIGQAILERKRVLGSRLVILGHHYQQDEVIRFADFTGDSLKLSQIGGQQKEAEFIVFCGVHFMAESADILTDDGVKVILPDLSAGCSMADMADLEQVEEAWEFLSEACPEPRRECAANVIPITYVNSAATIKAFCGGHGGACCTSSNARKVLEWAFRQGDKVMFLPDQHLGRNTAYGLGFRLEEMAVWDPYEELGGNSPDVLSDSRIILWKGHCSVHQRFLPQHVAQVRERHPGIRVISHPECRFETVQLSDEVGSTEHIIKCLTQSPSGTKWAVGTEIHLVNRLKNENPDRFIIPLDDCGCLCSTMFRIDPPHLLWSLENLVEGRVVNQITVPPDIAADARISLNRMLEITG